MNATLEQVHTSFLRLVDARSDSEFIQKVGDNLKSYGEQLSTGIADVQEEIKPYTGKAQELANEFVKKASEVQNDIKNKHPEIFSGDVKKIQVI